MKKITSLVVFVILVCYQVNLYCAPNFRSIRQNKDIVGLYDKLEVSFWLNAEFKNPFDPEDIDITATFTSPSGKVWKIPGFYSSISSKAWMARFSWLVRFSGDELGDWSYVINVKDRNGQVNSETRKFKILESLYHGPIKISSNKRYLEHDDGAPFYGVGLWNNHRADAEDLDKFKKQGVNFISHIMTPLESWASGLGRYDQVLCNWVDDLINLLEERDMQLALSFWVHAYLDETVWVDGNERWFENPYQTVTTCKDFFRSEEAWAYQEKLYRYMIARWGYSRSLAIWFIAHEVNGMDGWASGDSLGVAKWGKKVHDYFKANDPWQHLTTGTRSGGIKEWWQEGYEIFDIAGREIYETQGFPMNKTGQVDKDETHPLTYSYRNYHKQVNKLWNGFEKPAAIPESGWDCTFYEMSMPGYKALYHNALWVSLASGAAITPNWWAWAHSDLLDENVVTYQILSYRRFTDHIPFSKLNNLSPLEISSSEGDAYAITSDQLIFGWAVNADGDMAGKTITIPKINKGKYKLKLYHTWRGSFLEENGKDQKIIEAKGKSLSFDIPILKVQGMNARYIGQDIAFLLEPIH